MYGSYGSYSSMTGAMSIPMDMTSSNLRAHDATCAFPSWPRRSSLSDSDGSSSRPTSFLSDDDLYFCMSSDPFAEDSSSVASASSSAAASLDAQLEMERELAMQRERERLQREQFVRQAILEKENQRRRQQQALRRAQLAGHSQPQQSRRSSPKKGQSPRSKLSSMTPIAEAKE